MNLKLLFSWLVTAFCWLTYNASFRWPTFHICSKRWGMHKVQVEYVYTFALPEGLSFGRLIGFKPEEAKQHFEYYTSGPFIVGKLATGVIKEMENGIATPGEVLDLVLRIRRECKT